MMAKLHYCIPMKMPWRPVCSARSGNTTTVYDNEVDCKRCRRIVDKHDTKLGETKNG